MYLKLFSSQECEIYPEKKLLKTTIREPFYTAGKQFNWDGNPVGVGLSTEIIEWCCDKDYSILVSIDNHLYQLKAIIWWCLAGQYNSYYKAMNKTLLVVPLDAMERLK